MMNSRHTVIPVTLTSVLLIFSACRPKPSTSLTASGTIEMTEIYLSPTAPGRVETLTVHEGDFVKAGQLIGTMNRYEKARKDRERMRHLLVSGSSTEQQVEDMDLGFRDEALVPSVDGIVLERISEPGEVVSPGVPVVIIGNPKEIWVKVYIPEREIGSIRLNQIAGVHVDSFPNRSFTGRVTFVSPKAEFTPKNVQTKEERVTQMFAVKVAIDSTEGILKPGMPADVDISN